MAEKYRAGICLIATKEISASTSNIPTTLFPRRAGAARQLGPVWRVNNHTVLVHKKRTAVAILANPFYHREADSVAFAAFAAALFAFARAFISSLWA